MSTMKAVKYVILLGLAAGFLGILAYSKMTATPKYGEDGLLIRMEVIPNKPKTGEITRMVFTLEDKYGYAPTLYVNHARRLHAVIVGEDMDTFGHIHPEDFGAVTDTMLYGGKYEVEFNFPKAGNYVIALDGKTDEGEIHRKFSLSVSGEDKMVVAEEDFRTVKCFKGYQEDGEDKIIYPIFSDASEADCSEGYSVKLSTEPEELISGEPAKISYHVEMGGEYVKDLNPYLNAGAHFIVVSKDMKTVMHAHGGPEEMKMNHSYFRLIPTAFAHGFGLDDVEEQMEPRVFGPHITSEEIIFPEAGVYYIFGQFKHRGKIVFTKFAVNVSKEGNNESVHGE